MAALPGVEEAGLFIGTPANKEILRDAGILGPEGEGAAPGDLILALRARDDAAGAGGAGGSASASSISRAARARRRRSGTRARSAPPCKQMPDANLALISVPGHFAAAEARKALGLGLHVMIFSDNVPIEEEAALKREARERGLMVMGPDCGTAIIAGTPLAFANAVPRGDIGIIGASGTGIQEVSCLIARAGGGISHAIGTGGRDLKPEVGAITTLMAIDALDADAATRHIVLISKPPAAADRAAGARSRGAGAKSPSRSAFSARRTSRCRRMPAPPRRLRPRPQLALGRPVQGGRTEPPALRPERGALVRGLFAGGTFCAEAQLCSATPGSRSPPTCRCRAPPP